MNYKLFARLYFEASEYNNLDAYIAERGWQEWMDDIEDVDVIAKILTDIYTMAKTPLKEIRTERKISRADFCRTYHVPVRTVEDWELKDFIPEYVKCMICYSIFIDQISLQEENDE